MSTWRLNGYVQDSDEEEEDLETQTTNSSPTSQRVEAARVSSPHTSPFSSQVLGHGVSQELGSKNDGFIALRPSAQPSGGDLPVSPSIQTAPQASPVAGSRGQNTGSVEGLRTSPVPKKHELERPIAPMPSEAVCRPFILEPLYDSDSSLSDPPSDDEPPFAFASPQRQHGVRVVIPQNKVIERTESYRASRSLRERKPIQLHPYLLEGERYRQECQRRGIKPVVRPQSPVRHTVQNDAESQEQEFEPNHELRSNSPPDITVRTPATRKSKNNELHGSITRRSVAGSIERWQSFHQRDPHSSVRVKRRKLNGSDKQLGPVRRLADNAINKASDHNDIWAVPQSPPYSSSPMANEHFSNVQQLSRAINNTPFPDLPTPVDSSSLRGGVEPLELSDSGSDVVPTQRPERPLFDLISLLSDSSSDDSSLEDGPADNEVEVEVRKVGKRIKGVLPASWLRLDRQAQERRKAQTKNYGTGIMSPERGDIQRGVAQKRRGLKNPRGRTGSSNGLQDVVVISDASDNEPLNAEPPIFTRTGRDVQEASNLAAEFDARYAHDDVDVDDMENDELPLFAAGGVTRKRKRQSKLTDTFSRTSKKPRFEDDHLPKRKSVSTKGRGPSNLTRKKRSRPIAPRLSILDVEGSPSERSRASTPQFIRLARRQARRRPDLGRQSPHGKAIRLHTSRDTEDAQAVLQQWRKGAIQAKERGHAGKSRINYRPPLQDRANNQQHIQPTPSVSSGLTTTRKAQKPHEKDRQSLVTSVKGLAIFQRHPLSHPHGSTKTGQNRPQKTALRNIPLPRTAQLEGLEADFGRTHHRIAFARGLQQVDQQFAVQLHDDKLPRNPQLARFLADEDAVLPPLPTAKDIGEPQDPKRNGPSPFRGARILKAQARRIDTETREYRQPSEPAIRDVLDIISLEDAPKEEQLVLSGLAPFGHQYATHFDVSPLVVGTYFQSATFIGSEEFRRSLRIDQRDMDTHAGYYELHYNNANLACSSWNDQTFVQFERWFKAIWLPLESNASSEDAINVTMTTTALKATSSLLRSLVNYFATRLNFLDAVDRRDLASKMSRLLEFLVDNVLFRAKVLPDAFIRVQTNHESVRTLSYLLVLCFQVHRISSHSVVEPPLSDGLARLFAKIGGAIVQHILRLGITPLSEFLERNKEYKQRETGIADYDLFVESVVICIHLLGVADIPGATFWDLISNELSLQAVNASDVKRFDSIWASVFTLLPFAEMDASGILVVGRRSTFKDGNWGFIKDSLKQLFFLYPGTALKDTSALNDYIRANLKRCYILQSTWHWNKCDPMLTAMFDFFGRNGLRQLKLEESKGSPQFLERLADQPLIRLEAEDRSFNIFLKCVASGLQGMREVYPEKKLRSIILRCTPNHGRSYPKDKEVTQESLVPLRNHHDLLCTLYWASPPPCRPKIDLLRGLVQHESSHQAACRLNVRAWANLAAFQLSVDEPYAALQPLATWHKEIMQQTLRQYRSAKTEAEEDYKTAQSDITRDITIHDIRDMIKRNQTPIISTLRDCIAGMQNALKQARFPSSARSFLIDSGIVQLLELAHVDDPRLTIVIREALAMLREYAALYNRLSKEEVSQVSSEESQDYGDFPDLDDLDGVAQQPPKDSDFDFIQTPLWHLLSNAFGAETAPDDNLLMECIDTWAIFAGCQVASGVRSWTFFLGSFSQVGWHQLRDTDQTRKFRPYFMASLIECDVTAYEENHQEYLSALLVSLADRESMLRFQHRLLRAVVQADPRHPLLQNLPFYVESVTMGLDITLDNLRSRRLSLISSILANMRDNYLISSVENVSLAATRKLEYAALLKDFMSAMKNNYLQLQQGSTVTGAYVEFVQTIVQFLTQYVSDICPVLSFFTDSVAFPLPAGDPTYVIGRLCGYAPKLAKPGVTKQLSAFVQIVVQQAASDNQQPYLVNQLITALSSSNKDLAASSSLRSVLLQGIFPAYIEEAFSGPIGQVIARPILQSLQSILPVLSFDLRVTDPGNVQTICNSIASIAYTFIRCTETLVNDAALLTYPHILEALMLMFDIVGATLPILDYISSRTLQQSGKPDVVLYIEKLSIFAAEVIHNMIPHNIPIFDGNTTRNTSPHADLLAFCTRDLKDDIKRNWSEAGERIFFGYGNARREVAVSWGSLQEEKTRLVGAIERFHHAVGTVYGGEGSGGRERVTVDFVI
ncbi:hypothetical protein P154DRAFT_523535 [Amniculicola lignicola CBS 123094]|uniref:Mus7/MMS22 family-domain-containing protein n=1 Tax=Amniculicola lignicola CBS 123094 TaxID=1392246 RepID=A0A6A5WNE9_9PLEO|nr:hypothetical protein P154DRAFT_523535 [Amniculicola lignicola CBS 123094]